MPAAPDPSGQDLNAVARSIIDANSYLVLGTADPAGRPWTSPVYFSPASYREFYWVSSPEARHSRNLHERPGVSIVVFDSRVALGEGQAVYMVAEAAQVTDDELERGMEVFSARALARGGDAWPVQRVRPPAVLRLYRAVASEHWVLHPEIRPDTRTPVTPARSPG